MSRPIAGSRRPQQDGMSIDYADVLRQAVENERWRVLRDVAAAVATVKTDEPASGSSYRMVGRPAGEVKRDILAAIKRIEQAP